MEHMERLRHKRSIPFYEIDDEDFTADGTIKWPWPETVLVGDRRGFINEHNQMFLANCIISNADGGPAYFRPDLPG